MEVSKNGIDITYPTTFKGNYYARCSSMMHESILRIRVQKIYTIKSTRFLIHRTNLIILSATNFQIR